MRTKIILASFFVAVLTIILSFMPVKPKSIDGSWSIVKVENINYDGTKFIVIPKQSQAIFAGKYYSFCWSSDDSKAISWLMSDEEKLNRMNRTIVNTGRFYFKDNLLFTEADYALNPKFVKGIAKFNYSYSGDTLVLKCTSVVSKDNVLHPFYEKTYTISKLLRNK